MNNRAVLLLIVALNALMLLFGVVEAAAWVVSILSSGNVWATLGLVALLGIVVVAVLASMPDMDIDIDIETEDE